MPISQAPGFRVRGGHTRSDHLLQPRAVCGLVFLVDSKQGPAQQSRFWVSRAGSPGGVILIFLKMCFEKLGLSPKWMAQKEKAIQQPLTGCLVVPRTGCTVVAGWVSPLALGRHTVKRGDRLEIQPCIPAQGMNTVGKMREEGRAHQLSMPGKSFLRKRTKNQVRSEGPNLG